MDATTWLWLAVAAVYFILLGLRLTLVPTTFQTTIWPVAGIFAAGVSSEAIATSP